jgi:putative flippase GtrA
VFDRVVGGATAVRQTLATSERCTELIWFLMIGGVSAGLYVVINGTLTMHGVPPTLSLVVTLTLLIPPTYLAQRRLTFRSEIVHGVAFPRYLATQLVGNGIALVGTTVFAHSIIQQPFIAFTAIAALVAAVNYSVLKLWAFRN